MSGATLSAGTSRSTARGRRSLRLAPLRDRIVVTRQRRYNVRRFVAGATLALAVLAVVIATFLVDWMLALSRGGRFLLLLAAVGAVAWAWWRYVRPWLRVSESDLDLALLVERENDVDSDLVAALQFESEAADSWGSTDLQGAVIDYVADSGGDWQVPTRVAGADIRRRLTWLGGTAAVVVLAVLLRPDFAWAFVNRMLLGSMHYPTRTRIESLVIAGTEVDLAHPSRSVVKSPLGHPLDFQVGVGGVAPDSARLRVVDKGAGQETVIDLTPDQDGKTFAGRLPRLLEPVRAEVYAGDAWTDPVEVQVVPLPIVEMAITAETPAYARSTAEAEPAATPGARQIAVLEGSRVSLRVSCENKRLASVELAVDGKRHPFRRDGDAWVLAGDGSPLARILQPVQFEVEVRDEDDLAPEAPVTGTVRIKPDAAPQVAVDIRGRLVLPDGKPRLEWRIGDDHGIRAAELVLEPARTGTEDAPKPLTVPLLPAAGAGWTGRDALPLSGATPLPLGSLGLRKGDQVRITLRATDFRGDLEGRTTASDPILVDVTDEAGLLAALSESDEVSARQIDAILERQLQVGGQQAVPDAGQTQPRDGAVP